MNDDELTTLAYRQIYRPTTPAIVEAAKRRGHPVEYVDNEGDCVEVLAASAHPNKPFDVCFMRRTKKLAGEGQQAATDVRIWISFEADGCCLYDSSIASYNPYFGCTVDYIGWHNDVLIAVYTSKSETYAFRLDPKQLLAMLDAEDDAGDWGDEPNLDQWEGWGDSRKISDQWAIIEGYLVAFSRAQPPRVDVLSIDVCAPVVNLSLGQARQRGLVPRDYS